MKGYKENVASYLLLKNEIKDRFDKVFSARLIEVVDKKVDKEKAFIRVSKNFLGPIDNYYLANNINLIKEVLFQEYKTFNKIFKDLNVIKIQNLLGESVDVDKNSSKSKITNISAIFEELDSFGYLEDNVEIKDFVESLDSVLMEFDDKQMTDIQLLLIKAVVEDKFSQLNKNKNFFKDSALVDIVAYYGALYGSSGSENLFKLFVFTYRADISFEDNS